MALRLHAQGLLTSRRLEELQHRLAVVDELYAGDADHEALLRKTLSVQLRLAASEARREDVLALEAQEGRTYAHRLNQAGVKAAAGGASGVVFIAGMLGVPTSQGEALLMVAVPVGGYLLVKVGGMALKRAAFLLRSARNANEVVARASKLGLKVQKVQDTPSLRTAVAREDLALEAHFNELLARLPPTETRAPSTPQTPTVTSMRQVEVRSQAPRSSTAEMSHGSRRPVPDSARALKHVNPKAFSRWLSRAKRRPARDSPEAYRYQRKYAGPEEIQVEGGGERIWTDGARMETARLVEVKFIASPEKSPFIQGSQCDTRIRAIIQEEVTAEFRRYAAVLADTSTPAVGLEVIVNDARAAPFFEELLRAWAIPGEVLVRP
jgi:hypothetical protein